MDRADLDYWLAARFPVILILYDALEDIAYWVYVQEYFSSRSEVSLTMVGESVTIHINRSDVVETEAVRLFAQYKAQVLDQLRRVVQNEE